MDITFSFIIPTYNSKKTIIRAIESVTKQLDKSEYEIIIVDDGSQDGTVELVHDFMKDNGNIHFTSTIGGVSFARNKGINQAQGEYLLFLDSDDYYVEGSLKNLKNIVAQSNSDLVIFNFEHGNAPILLAEVPNTRVEALSVMLSNPTKYMTVWGKAYRTETVHENNVRFNEDLKLSEDSEFLVRYVQKCKKITSDNIILYHYSIDNVSVMRGKNKQSKIPGYLESLEVVQKDIFNNIPELKQAFYQYTVIQMNIMMVREIFNYGDNSNYSSKVRKSDELLKNKTINEAIKQMKLRDCMSPRFLPVFFIKMGMLPLARLMFRLRSWSNYRKESSKAK